jgi:hypothetical protein
MILSIMTLTIMTPSINTLSIRTPVKLTLDIIMLRLLTQVIKLI